MFASVGWWLKLCDYYMCICCFCLGAVVLCFVWGGVCVVWNVACCSDCGWWWLFLLGDWVVWLASGLARLWFTAILGVWFLLFDCL